MTQTESLTIPGWALKIGLPALGLFQVCFGVLFTIGISLMRDNNAEIRGLRDQVTILNVQMDQALKTDSKFETLRDQVNVLSLRVARVEGKREAEAERP